jgi:sulfur carrier protein
MEAFIEKEGKTKSVKFSGKVKRLLKELKINPETVIIIRNNALITTEDTLKNNDEIKILSVISGG